MENKQIGLFGEEPSMTPRPKTRKAPKKIDRELYNKQFGRDEVLEELIKQRIVRFVLTGRH